MAQAVLDRKTPLWRRPVVIGAVVAVALLVAMGLSTKFVASGSLAQKADTATAYADLNYDKVVVPKIADGSQPLDTLVKALVANADEAGKKYGHREADGKPWSFATKATGTVTKGDFGEIGLQVDGMPDGITAGVAVPPFGSNTAIRDAGTDVKFGDFTNQTEFQNVAIELNKRAVASVYGKVDPQSLIGKKVTVTGAFTWTSTTGGDIKHVTIIPVKIEVQQ